MGSEVDCSGVSRAVWFIKVVFNLSDALANKEDKDQDVKVPRDYKMVLSKVEQSIGVFSEGSPARATEVEEKGDKSQLTFEGVIVQSVVQFNQMLIIYYLKSGQF
ncbi:General transcription factorIIF subunit 2 [Porites harrisoni]